MLSGFLPKFDNWGHFTEANRLNSNTPSLGFFIILKPDLWLIISTQSDSSRKNGSYTFTDSVYFCTFGNMLMDYDKESHFVTARRFQILNLIMEYYWEGLNLIIKRCVCVCVRLVSEHVETPQR